MTAIDAVNVGLAGLNVVLALVLSSVYVRNYAKLRSPFTLGLLLFALFLIVHNAMVVWKAWTMMDVAAPGDASLLLVDELLQLAAVGALVWATVR